MYSVWWHTYTSHQFNPIEVYELHKGKILKEVKLSRKRHADLLEFIQAKHRGGQDRQRGESYGTLLS